MKRREFFTLLGGAAAMWPVTARAQQSGGMRQIGVLQTFEESDPQSQSEIGALRQALEPLGWREGSNIRTVSRFGTANADRRRMLAKELVALNPEVIVTRGTPTTTAVAMETLPTSKWALSR
jgi:putative ABC transport system substrate-binding protein